MKKNITHFFIKIIPVSLIMLYANKVLAQGLVSCGYETHCTFADVITMSQGVIEFILSRLILPIAAIMLVYAGFLYLSGKQSNIEKAHSVFPKVILGLIIILVSWLIVRAILYALGIDVTDYSLLES
jgi:hypothetical protein